MQILASIVVKVTYRENSGLPESFAIRLIAVSSSAAYLLIKEATTWRKIDCFSDIFDNNTTKMARLRRTDDLWRQVLAQKGK